MSVSRLIFIGLIVVAVVLFWRGRGGVRVEAWKKILLVTFATGVVVTILNPEITTWLAEVIGIGRGTDLLGYFTAIALFIVAINSYLSQRSTNEAIAALTREVALQRFHRQVFETPPD